MKLRGKSLWFRSFVTLVLSIAAVISPVRAQFYKPSVQDFSKYRQRVLDTARLDVRYYYRVQRDPAKLKDTLVDCQQLLLGSTVAWYRSLNLAMFDSACTADFARGRDAGMAPSGSSGEWVYRGYPNAGKSTVTLRISNYDFLQCTEDIPAQQWLLHPETRQIGGHLCQRATCLFRGREWTAWYATDLPVPEGPWKLRGLPGLIMLAHDAHHEHEWRCTGIYSHCPQPIVWYDMDWDKTSRVKMREMMMWVAQSPITYICERDEEGVVYIGRAKVTATEASKYDRHYASPYNSIELE